MSDELPPLPAPDWNNRYGGPDPEYMEDEMRSYALAARAPLEAEVARLTEERDALRTICAEAYQVVGSLADECGRFGDGSATKILDNLSQMKLVHSDVLPFEQRAALAEDAARYRLLRRGQHWSVIDGAGDTLRAETLDAAIDQAREAK